MIIHMGLNNMCTGPPDAPDSLLLRVTLSAAQCMQAKTLCHLHTNASGMIIAAATAASVKSGAQHSDLRLCLIMYFSKRVRRLRL